MLDTSSPEYISTQQRGVGAAPARDSSEKEEGVGSPQTEVAAVTKTMSSRERSASLDCDNLEHMKRFSSQEMEALSLPPPTADGELLEVDFRMTVFHIGEVNTREQNAKIKIGLVQRRTHFSADASPAERCRSRPDATFSTHRYDFLLDGPENGWLHVPDSSRHIVGPRAILR